MRLRFKSSVGASIAAISPVPAPSRAPPVLFLFCSFLVGFCFVFAFVFRLLAGERTGDLRVTCDPPSFLRDPASPEESERRIDVAAEGYRRSSALMQVGEGGYVACTPPCVFTSFGNNRLVCFPEK